MELMWWPRHEAGPSHLKISQNARSPQFGWFKGVSSPCDDQIRLADGVWVEADGAGLERTFLLDEECLAGGNCPHLVLVQQQNSLDLLTVRLVT